MHGPKKLFLRRFNYFFTTLATKILPFQIWALFYPYRSNYSYIYDNDGSQLVDHIGITENLEEKLKDLSRILIFKAYFSAIIK